MTDQSASRRLLRGVRLETDKVTRRTGAALSGRHFELNETAHAIVERCDGLTVWRILSRRLAAEYEIDPEDDLRADVSESLDDLATPQTDRSSHDDAAAIRPAR